MVAISLVLAPEQLEGPPERFTIGLGTCGNPFLTLG